MDELFYIQDSRRYFGNFIVWLGVNGDGYTCDVKKAGVFSREEADTINKENETYIPWGKDHVESITSHLVDSRLFDK